MNDRIEDLPLPLVAEDDRSQRLPVERSVVSKDGPAEVGDEGAESVGFRFDGNAGEDVEVDDGD
jgi:hypothetical protein